MHLDYFQQLVVGTAALRLLGNSEEQEVFDEEKELKEGIYAVLEGDEGEIKSARVSMSGGHVLLHALEDGPPPQNSLTLQVRILIKLSPKSYHFLYHRK